MRQGCATELRERALADLATRQHGVVGRGQLVALGFPDKTIARRISAGRLHRLHHGVYAVGHRVLGADGRRKAATLAVSGCWLAHRSAGAKHLLRPYSGTPEVVVLGDGGRRPRTDVRVRRVAHLAPPDVTVIDGIPVTTPARTLLDCAAIVPDGLATMLNRAERLELFDLRAITAAIERAPRQRGARRLLAAVAEVHPESRWTRSELEDAMFALCRRHDLPVPRPNATAEGLEVDFLWEAHRLAGEADGWETHRTRRAFQDDRRRDRALQLAGYRVLRFTFADVEHRPEAVAADLRRALAAP